jgi:spermidine synthase
VQYEGYEVVARARSERGEVVVRRSPGGTLELRVNGVFVMDTAETGTERQLARATLGQVPRPRRVLVGGLGLGYTVRELLTDDRVEDVVVAEIEPDVVAWMRAGVLPNAEVLADPRVRVVVDDVRRVVDSGRAEPSRPYDVVLLDVDNGPDFLVYADNAAVYTPGFLVACRRVLDADGVLCTWSSTYSHDLAEAQRAAFGTVDAQSFAVDLQGRREHYWLFTSKMTL